VVGATAVLAHLAGMPVEEVVSLALTVGGMASAGARLAWLHVRSARQLPERRGGVRGVVVRAEPATITAEPSMLSVEPPPVGASVRDAAARR
jgi:hypothetical protein